MNRQEDSGQVDFTNPGHYKLPDQSAACQRANMSGRVEEGCAGDLTGTCSAALTDRPPQPTWPAVAVGSTFSGFHKVPDESFASSSHPGSRRATGP